MNKKIILLSTFAILGVLVCGQAVYAANPSLSITPATATVTAGSPFNVSVQLNPEGNKVCVITGAINFNGLTCQSITMTSGLMAQVVPTCTSPSFIIGIPKCTTIDQNIFSVSVVGNQAGQANIAFTGLKVIGAGSNVSSIWQGGAYRITAVVIPVITPVVAPAPTAPTEEVAPAETQEIQAPVEEITLEDSIPTGVGAAALSEAGMKWFNYLLIAFGVAVILYGIYYFIIKRKKK